MFFFFEKILGEVNEIVASGAFVEPNLPFIDEMDVILTEITEPRFKAFYTLCGKYEAVAKKAEDAISRSMLRSYMEDILDENFDKLDLAVSDALKNEQAAQEIFDIELGRFYPQLLHKVRLGFRVGWLVVERKRSKSNLVSQEIDHRFRNVHMRVENSNCHALDCLVRGIKVPTSNEVEETLQKPVRMRHNMRAFKNRNGPL